MAKEPKRLVVPGDPSKDAAIKEWVKRGKALLKTSELKNYGRDDLLALADLLGKGYVDAQRYAYYRLEQATKGPTR